MVHDAQFGPLVMVAAGGACWSRSSVTAASPSPRSTIAGAGHARPPGRPSPAGRRPRCPPADLDAVADAVVNLSTLAVDLGPSLAALDVNPLIAGADGCVAVDALVIAGSA